MKAKHLTRLLGEKKQLEENLSNEGARDGGDYAKNAPYRELRLIAKLADAYGDDFDRVEIDADLLACTVCEVESPDCDSRNWVETNLSTSWKDEEEYVRGFIEGALDVLAEVDSAESKTA